MRSTWTLALRSALITGCVVVCGLASAQAMPSHGFMAFVPPSTQTTHLIGIQQGSALSQTVSHVRSEVVELGDGKGTLFYLKNKYKTNWQDLQLTFLTEINPNFGLIFGFGTGERGPNYKIEPSLQLGFIHLTQIDKKSNLQTRFSYRFAGKLKEKPCITSRPALNLFNTEENCRLTTSLMPIEETLNFLWNEAPRDRLVIALRYVRHF
jgi:hypothetical protein